MQILDQQSAFLKFKFPQHSELKTKLLELINMMGIHSMIEEPVQCVSNTDWHLSPSVNRVYYPLIQPVIEFYNEEIKNVLHLPRNLVCSNFWFQQYKNQDYHDWHVHPNCLYSSVYYLDLPEGTSKTTFKVLGKEFEVAVDEGDWLVFPGSTVHCSKPNKSEKIKTIIAFNFTEQTV
jgi:hypothetical protein